MGKQTARHCEHVSPTGKPCGGYALHGGKYCWAHDEANKKKARAASRKGGKARCRPRAVLPFNADNVQFKCFSDIVNALADTFNRVRKGELDYRIGNCLGTLAGQIVKAMQAKELEEMAERLAELEERLKANDQPQYDCQPIGGTGGESTSSSLHPLPAMIRQDPSTLRSEGGMPLAPWQATILQSESSMS
jgi:hypothetical protein